MQFSFRCCLWWFIMLEPRSFSNDVIVNNPFFITSDNSFQRRTEFIAFMMQITSVDAFCWMNFFQFMWNPNIKFFNESKMLYMIWWSIVDFGIFNIPSISRTITWRYDSIVALIWSPWASFGRPERCSSLSEKSPKRKKILIHKDNVPSHKVVKTVTKLSELNYELFSHPPYSPDLAPLRLLSVPKLKEMFARQEMLIKWSGHCQSKRIFWRVERRLL